MKRILTKETILIVLFLLSASLIMLGVFYYDMSTELSEKEKGNLSEIGNEYKIVVSKYESMAKFLYSYVDSREDLKEIFYRSSREKNSIKSHFIRKEFIDAITPFYDEVRRHDFYDIQLHFEDGTNFVRMRQNTKYGDKVPTSRRAVLSSNRQKKYFSGLEQGRFISAYRYAFPIFFNDEHIGSVEFSVSLQTMMESLSDLFGGNYQIILNGSKNDIEVLDKSNWCHSEDFCILGYSNRNVEEIIKKCDQRSVILQKINIFEDFANHLTYNSQEFIAGFLSIMNSIGEKAGYLIKVKESKEISEIHDTFALNSMINILITLMLIILILSYNNVQGRIKEMKMFDAMVVTANHEIKQPLSIITAYIEILVNDDNIDKKTKTKLRKIWANADKINYILEKLKNIEDPEYVDYANFTKMIDIENKNKSSIEG